MDITQYYRSGRYTVQNEKVWKIMYKKRLEYIKKALEGYKFKTVLDAACGNGGLGKLIKDEWGIRVCGVDFSKKGIMLAKRNGIEAKVGDLSKKIPFGNKSFDMVFSSETIEHLVNPDRFIKEVHRILKQDGLLVLTTPNLSSWLNRILFLFGIYPLVLEASTETKVGLRMLSKFTNGEQAVGHIHVFSYHALVDFLAYHGYTIERIVGMPIDFVSPRSKWLTKIYRIVDAFFLRFIPLSSNYVVVAKKL